ncbi:nodulation protein H-like [Capsicum chacoense]
MPDHFCFFTKDTFIIKPPKKSPLLLRVVVLLFAMICGIYICSICLKQIGSRSSGLLATVHVIERPCETTNVEPSEKPYVHFPKPKTFSRAECACNPVRFFAILSTQRSGSGWFETLLNSHTNISSNGEIFSVKVRKSNASTILETLDQLYDLDFLTSASKNECTAAVGLKWMLNQGLLQHHEEIVEYFKRRGVSAIFLFRRNLLRRMVSMLANSYDQNAKLLNGTHKSHVHSPKEAEILASYKPKINTATLIDNLKQVQGMAANALEYFKSTRHMILFYEDVIKNQTMLNDVQDFLNVPRMDLHSRQVKIHKGPLSSQVENWSDVEKALKGTPYESFLHADYKI